MEDIWSMFPEVDNLIASIIINYNIVFSYLMQSSLIDIMPRSTNKKLNNSLYFIKTKKQYKYSCECPVESDYLFI